jgi:hypothetical protein
MENDAILEFVEPLFQMDLPALAHAVAVALTMWENIPEYQKTVEKKNPNYDFRASLQRDVRRVTRAIVDSVTLRSAEATATSEGKIPLAKRSEPTEDR